MAITLQELQNHVDQQKYDKNYQDIEVLNFVGYSKSHCSWHNICKLNIDWKDKIVCDLGCFHSYFGIKALKSGASVVYGLDLLPQVITTSKLISESSNVNIEYAQWEGGEETPQCDIALVLNVLHHCSDQDLTLRNLKCSFAVFEINLDQILTISKYFQIMTIEQSHRDNRAIVYAKKV